MERREKKKKYKPWCSEPRRAKKNTAVRVKAALGRKKHSKEGKQQANVAKTEKIESGKYRARDSEQ